MAQMQLNNACKDYGSLRVIDKLNLKVEDGSFTVFVGPSGCGKSTLLRMIAGLEHISDGELLIDGERKNEATPVGRGVAMVFQNYALYPHMSVERNIGFGLKMAKLEKKDIQDRVQKAAEILKIEPLLKRKPAALSGGQRQRVAIGRAIVREPGLFLFDEPLSNLDAELRVAMRVEIAKLHRTLGSTMIYVTHDQTEAMTLADTIVVLHDGTIEQVGSPVELYNDPDNMFVAGFIGSPRMNFLQGTVTLEGNGANVQLLSGARIPVTPEQTEQWTAGMRVHVGMRPEHLRVCEKADPSSISVNVDVMENLGGTRYIYGQTGDGENITVEYREEHLLRSGDTVSVRMDTDKLRLFAESGARLRLATV